MLHNKLFTRSIQIELHQIEHLVPGQLAEPCGNTRTLDAVAGCKWLGLQSTDSTHCHGKSAASQGFGFGILLADVWGFLTLWLFAAADFQVGHQWYSHGTLGKYQAWLCDFEGNSKGMGTQVVIPLLRKGLTKEWIGVLGGGRIYPKIVLPVGWPV